ncbi:hypothetical protein [Brasilonema sp. UFV-L1]|nr:hypothetical protein [Brasilonema sp. UFV-L1]
MTLPKLQYYKLVQVQWTPGAKNILTSRQENVKLIRQIALKI